MTAASGRADQPGPCLPAFPAAWRPRTDGVVAIEAEGVQGHLHALHEVVSAHGVGELLLHLAGAACEGRGSRGRGGAVSAGCSTGREGRLVRVARLRVALRACSAPPALPLQADLPCKLGPGGPALQPHPPVKYSISAVSRTGPVAAPPPMMMVPSCSTTICLPPASIIWASLAAGGREGGAGAGEEGVSGRPAAAPRAEGRARSCGWGRRAPGAARRAQMSHGVVQERAGSATRCRSACKAGAGEVTNTLPASLPHVLTSLHGDGATSGRTHGGADGLGSRARGAAGAAAHMGACGRGAQGGLHCALKVGG